MNLATLAHLQEYIEILKQRDNAVPTIERVVDTLVSCTALVACSAQLDQRHVQKDLKKRLESVSGGILEAKRQLDEIYGGEVVAKYHENDVMTDFDLMAMIEVSADLGDFDCGDDTLDINEMYEYISDQLVTAAGYWCLTTPTPRASKDRIAKTVIMMMNQISSLPMFQNEWSVQKVIVPVLTKSNSETLRAEKFRL